MSNHTEVATRLFAKPVGLALMTLLWTAVLPAPANSGQVHPQKGAYPLMVSHSAVAYAGLPDDKNSAKTSQLVIPLGTILPVRLNSTISSTNCKTGQVITGRIMQDVPLSPGGTIKAGSKVIGHIVEVTPASAGASTQISLQFDKLISAGQQISILTNLRAMAGFMAVREAQTPSVGMAEGDNFYALTTVQVGGDVVYGVGGPVTTAESPNDVVGKALTHGVLGQVRANEGGKCRGPIDGNNNPQALWVFSADACGVYDLEHISIVHSGRSNPIGAILLASNTDNLKLQAGTGMLLRVN
jgi:hypothetical protein